MMAGRDFVVLSDDWDGLPTSTIHLFRRIARDHRVFWFRTVGRMPRPTAGDAHKALAVAGKWLGRCFRGPTMSRHPSKTALANLHVECPFMVPWFKPAMRRLNRASFLSRYRRLASAHAIEDPVVITTFPYASDLVRALEGTRIYYCVDDFLEYPGVNHGDWRVMEHELLEAVDGLVVSCSVLARKQTRLCPLLHLPHGVDFEHFSEAARRPARVAAMESVPRPIVGFFGLLSEWVDLELIASLARAFPQASFVLLGRAEVPIRPLNGLSNVHFLGPVPYATLPAYARYFDVGLIPFVLNDLTRAVNPLKLMEYLSLGLPVLSTRLPELGPIKGPIWLCSTRDEFRESLGEILDGDRARYAEAAVAVARENTWESRAEQLVRFVDQVAATTRADAVSRVVAAEQAPAEAAAP